MIKSHTKKLTLSAMFLAIGFALPMLTGQIPVIGKALLPMHIPIFLCAMVCGWKYALAIGIILPLTRSLIFSVPLLYPTAIAVAFEMATYGLVTGLLFSFKQKRTIGHIYIAMLPAMFAGRIVRCVAEIILLGFSNNAFVFKTFLTGTLLNAIPGIIIQLTLIPAVMLALMRVSLAKSRVSTTTPRPLVDVYLAPLPQQPPTFPILCEARRAEIENTANERLRREKHYVWQLLCYGLEKSLGLCEADLIFTKEKSGAWTVAGAEISLSHSEGALAVAISLAPVGIDIERVRPHKDKALAARILTDAERAALDMCSTPERNALLLTYFTGKEAVFKAAKGGVRLSEIDTVTASLKSEAITVNEEPYIWSVATDTPQYVRVFTDIDLT